HEFEWPGTNRLAVEISAAAVRHNTEGRVGKVPEQSGIRLAEMQQQRCIVGCLNLVHKFVRTGFWSNDGAVAHGIQGPLYVAGGERPAIVKTNAVSKMKDVGLRV